MYNPLEIKTSREGSFIDFPMEAELVGKLFYCVGIANYQSFEEGIERTVARYSLIDRQNNDTKFIIEAIRISEDKYELRYFELLQEIPFDWNFMGLVGTSPFGYAHPKYPSVDQIMYDKVRQSTEEYVQQEFGLSEDHPNYETRDDWAQKDEDGDYFYTVDRSMGVHRELAGPDYPVFAWMYKRDPEPDMPLYMLIEVKAYENAELYSEINPPIEVYEGRKILLSDLKIA